MSDVLQRCLGKTIRDVIHVQESGSDDSLVIELSDGSKLIINARWCNDTTAALDIEEQL